MEVVVIGQGYVGLPLSIQIAKSGLKVTGFDINADVVSNLNLGLSHIEDISDDELKSVLNPGSYSVTSDVEKIKNANVVIICVPTPLDNQRKPDVSYLEHASKIIGENLSHQALIVNESTSFPGTLRNIVKKNVEKYQTKFISHDYAVSPERVDPQNKDWSIRNTPRLISGLSTSSQEAAIEFYSNFCEELVKVESPEVAEAAKLFENTFRHVNIALVNEFWMVCEAMGLNVHDVINAASTKPYGFLKFIPSVGVGGHCIPVDPIFLETSAAEAGTEFKFIKLASEINLKMPESVIKVAEKKFGFSLREKKILVVGITYKKDVADTRESASLRFISELKKLGNQVYWFDPKHPSSFMENMDGENIKKYDVIFNLVNHLDFDYKVVLSKSSNIFNLVS